MPNKQTVPKSIKLTKEDSDDGVLKWFSDTMSFTVFVNVAEKYIKKLRLEFGAFASSTESVTQ